MAEVCTGGEGKNSTLCKGSGVGKGDLPGDGGFIGPLPVDGVGLAGRLQVAAALGWRTSVDCGTSEYGS